MSVYSQWFYEVFDAKGQSLDKTLELDAARKRRPCEGWIETVDASLSRFPRNGESLRRFETESSNA